MNLSQIDVFGSMDWGFNQPGCFLLWLALPDGHYHIFREYKFTQTLADDDGPDHPGVATMVKRLVRDAGVGRMRYIAADPKMWSHEGHGKGEAIAETLARLKLPMRKGDNARELGWTRVHQLFGMAPDGRPWLTIDEHCRYLRRAIPAAVSDKHNPDDVDTTIDDHGLDALRYGAMSRPSPTRFAARPELPKQAVGRLLRQAQIEVAS